MRRRALRSTAPENSPKQPNAETKSRGRCTQDEREVYSVPAFAGRARECQRPQRQTTENSPKTEFSTVWTNSFHCVENLRNIFPLCGKNGLFFPQCGKYFSIAWKNREKVFHTVENFQIRSPRTGKRSE
jgi:hypothetical protein